MCIKLENWKIYRILCSFIGLRQNRDDETVAIGGLVTRICGNEWRWIGDDGSQWRWRQVDEDESVDESMAMDGDFRSDFRSDFRFRVMARVCRKMRMSKLVGGVELR